MKKKRALPLLAAAVVIIALILYQPAQCKVASSDLVASPPRPFVIEILEGYAIGFTFNMTNQSGCTINAQNIHVTLRSVTYPDGRQETPNITETQSVGGTLAPGETRTYSYSFNSYFTYRPTKLLLKIEITFAETGSFVVLDGELPLPG
jgi:hypothetical protein